jgi:hypothetical protein
MVIILVIQKSRRSTTQFNRITTTALRNLIADERTGIFTKANDHNKCALLFARLKATALRALGRILTLPP